MLDFSKRYQYSNGYQIHNLEDNMMKPFQRITLLFFILKISLLYRQKCSIVGTAGWKDRGKMENCHFPGKIRAVVPILP